MALDDQVSGNEADVLKKMLPLKQQVYNLLQTRCLSVNRADLFVVF